MDIIAIIPARGGSKGVPRKNIKELAGKPLIVYSIEVARESSFIDDVVVTTDDAAISEISRAAGAEVIRRPDELSGDQALAMDAVRHVLATQKEQGRQYDLLVLLEPTAPFRTAADVDATIQKLIDKQADSAATFSESATPLTRMWRIDKETPEPLIPDSDPFLPRQQQKKAYALNGMVYVLKVSMLDDFPGENSFLLGKKIAHLIPRERAIDIDSIYDFKLAEFLIHYQHNNEKT